MTKPNSQSYPPHHPYYGRPLIEVTDHDVLCGRGVNISQHPGNERFRALVNTRQDASYCSGFTTSEKRALAEEIVAHIRNLDPPGRFLKRLGRSQSSRGLHGPWEELSHRECIKKTCQALRDCNRQDRQGYAATVTAPTDVAMSAEERARSGLSLKEHAAAAAAAAAMENPNPSGYSFQPLQGSEGSVASNIQATFEYSGEVVPTKTPTRLSPTGDLGASWLKKQSTEDPLSVPPPVEDLPIHVADPVMSTVTNSQIHATPSPFVAPVPVSTTPPSTQSHNHINSQLGHHDYHHTDHLVLSRHTDSPQLPSPTTVYHHHHDSLAPAPYSPVVLLHEDDQNLDPHGHLDDFNNHGHDHHQPFDIHHPFNPSHHDDDDQHEDILQTAAAAAASSMGNNPHHHRDNSLSLINADDDGTHESLHLSDL